MSRNVFLYAVCWMQAYAGSKLETFGDLRIHSVIARPAHPANPIIRPAAQEPGIDQIFVPASIVHAHRDQRGTR
jgi:hypothetical protein